MSQFGAKTAESFKGSIHRKTGKVAKRPAAYALAEAIEPRVLLSVATYSLSVVAPLNSSTGDQSNGLVMDSQGNLYGTTQYGGANSDGTIYEIPAGASTPTVLASFSYSTTGENPVGTLVRDADGDLFGVTNYGGANNGGTIFELAAGSNTITVLASFDSNSGEYPQGGLTLDAQGNLFGTTQEDGANYDGEIFELASGASTITPLAAFGSVRSPAGSMVMDSSGNLYGITYEGGSNSDGSIFELASGDNSITTLASLDSSTSGELPVAGLTIDASGNLYGNSEFGGADNYGAIFELPSGQSTLTVLAPLSSATGGYGVGRLLLDGQGDLFGVGADGGANSNGGVFELPAGASSPVLLASMNSTTGQVYDVDPGLEYGDYNVITDGQGDLFGATAYGGANSDGTVYELAPVQATKVVVTQQPANITADNTDALQVQLENNPGVVDTANTSNVTVSIATGPAGATLGGTTTVAAVAGVADLSGLSFPVAGDYTLTLSDSSLTSATTASFTVGVGAASKLVITQQPASVTTDNAVSTTIVAVEDAEGNIVTSDTSNVSVALAGTTTGVLTGTTPVAAVNGVATFSDLAITPSGAYTLAFTDGSLTAADSTTITVPAVATLQAGQTLTPVSIDLSTTDQTYKKNEKLTATLVSGPDGAKLWGATSIHALNGVASFNNLKFHQAGTYTIAVTDAEGTVTTQTITVAPSTAKRLVFLHQPTVANGNIFTSVEIVDRFGNVVTTDTSDITLKVGPYGTEINAVLQGDVTEAAVNGVATFENLTISRSGFYHLIAKSGKDAPALSKLIEQATLA